MTSTSNLPPMSKREQAEYAYAVARDTAFEAVRDLWLRRSAEGMSQAELARALDRDPGWVSKNLRGPGNWTLRTLAEFIAALDAEIEITAHALEDTDYPAQNYHA